MSGRPGQPLDLTRYVKGDAAIPVPGSLYQEEQQRLGFVPQDLMVKRAPRGISHGVEALKAARSTYAAEMHAYRKRFMTEISESNARIKAREDAWRAGVRERKRQLDAARAIRKAATAAKTEVTNARAREAKRLRAEMARRGVELNLSRVDERRQAWLTALEEDSATWIPEDKIDALITPAMFSLKYSWQFARWFEVKDARAQAWETARRNKRPGQPLREPVYLDDETRGMYAADWESEVEGEEAAGAGAKAEDSRPIGAASADTNALHDDSARTAVGLTAARAAAAERARPFPEPAYGAHKGRDLDIESLWERVRRVQQRQGIQLGELYQGRSAARIMRDYEGYLRRVRARRGGAEAAAESNGEAHVKGGQKAGSLHPSLFLGEREEENAYIHFCATTRRMEALYYALTRKQRRLEAEGHQEALLNFNDTWGLWVREVDGLIFGRAGTAAAQDPKAADAPRGVEEAVVLDGSGGTTVDAATGAAAGEAAAVDAAAAAAAAAANAAAVTHSAEALSRAVIGDDAAAAATGSSSGVKGAAISKLFADLAAARRGAAPARGGAGAAAAAPAVPSSSTSPAATADTDAATLDANVEHAARVQAAVHAADHALPSDVRGAAAVLEQAMAEPEPPAGASASAAAAAAAAEAAAPSAGGGSSKPSAPRMW